MPKFDGVVPDPIIGDDLLPADAQFIGELLSPRAMIFPLNVSSGGEHRTLLKGRGFPCLTQSRPSPSSH